MKTASQSRPNEQRKIDKLLARLAEIRPISAKPAPIANGIKVLKTA